MQTSHPVLFATIFALPIVLAFGLPAVSLEAATYTRTYTCDIPLTRTDWSTPTDVNNCDLTKFDPSWGVLQAVNLQVTGNITSEVGLENRDTAPQTITANVTADIQLRRPDNSPFIVVLPTVSASRDLAVYDGVTDYAGPSGATFLDVRSSQVQNITYTDQTTLDLFTAQTPGLSEQLQLPAVATGDSDYQASANYAGYVDTYAGLTAQVQYSYTAQDLSVTLVSDQTTGSTGQNWPVDLRVRNLESEATTGNTTIRISMPEGLTFNNLNHPDWVATVENGLLVISTSVSMEPLVEVSIPLVFTPDPSLQGLTVNLPAELISSEFDPNLQNNSDTLSYFVSLPAPQTLVVPVTTQTTSIQTTTLIRTGGQDHPLLQTDI